jgi:crossover junction endodeoxyribonuclease RuvC
MKELVVVGLDPGLAATGYGVVKLSGRDIHCLGYGCVVTRSEEDTSVRLKRIYEEITGVLDQWSPQLVVLEEVFIKAAAPSSALSLGQVRGVLILAASQHGCQVTGITPREIKAAITGSGAADKYQIQQGLRRLLGLEQPIKPDHAADALGLAYVGVLRA